MQKQLLMALHFVCAVLTKHFVTSSQKKTTLDLTAFSISSTLQQVPPNVSHLILL